ncbi:MAG: hypothetical protein AVDCRST_MAG17-784 [uncultured Solirubrobacterales bacterium]|uniref:DUF4383 domain-containing protein n=1 Tax=uncultured Solirubrobacterales bacterium TaxID=768556 RepID=A0A6J4SE58_9ACTN|nr:MAG: hypothetical protein AVDCRST_MAG17-784 [uncultured Solirubrobacterales bacterium]
MEAAHNKPGGAGAKAKGGRSLAQLFSLVTGIVLIAVGVLGFFVNSMFNMGPGVSGDELIVFEVNGWHNIVHLATGAFLVFMAASARSAVTGLLIFGILYVIVTIYGFVDGDDLLTIVPINTADNFLHLALALAAIAVALSARKLLSSGAKERTA